MNWQPALGTREPQWPLSGYAPGEYTFKCLDCDDIFQGGDKRSTNCLPCAIDASNERIRMMKTDLRIAHEEIEMLKKAFEILSRGKSLAHLQENT